VATIRVGIAGWTYAGWRGEFYPPGLVHRLELAYAAQRFGSIEINGSFYSLQRPSSYLAWREQVPPEHVFAVKGGRFITHMKKLAGDRVWARADADRPLRHALEVRHDSFCSEEAVQLLAEHDVALVVADTAGRWPLLERVTSDFMYVRLHGDKELYVSGYSGEALDSWAARIRGWADQGLDVFAYFDNDVKVRAPYDALALMDRLGLTVG